MTWSLTWSLYIRYSTQVGYLNKMLVLTVTVQENTFILFIQESKLNTEIPHLPPKQFNGEKHKNIISFSKLTTAKILDFLYKYINIHSHIQILWQANGVKTVHKYIKRKMTAVFKFHKL
jgi:hypothetical protein